MILASKNMNFIPNLAAIISFATSRASYKLLIANSFHWITDLCALSVMQKAGEILALKNKHTENNFTETMCL